MRWALCFLLFGGLLALAESGPLLVQMRQWDEDTVMSHAVVGQILLFLAALLLWAIYLAARFVPWLAQSVVDVLFSVRGPAFPPEVYGRKSGPDGVRGRREG